MNSIQQQLYYWSLIYYMFAFIALFGLVISIKALQRNPKNKKFMLLIILNIIIFIFCAGLGVFMTVIALLILFNF